MRNLLRVTCGRRHRGKPQVPQEEAQKQTPVSLSTNAYPAQSRRREERHSSAAGKRTHRNTQGQPGRRAHRKTARPATAGESPSVGQADVAKRQHNKRSQGIQSQARKYPKHEQKFPKLARKPQIWGKNSPLWRHCAGQLTEPAQEPAAQPVQTQQEPYTTINELTHKTPEGAPHERQSMRLGKQGGTAAPGDTDEAINCAKEAAAPHPAQLAQGYDEQT